MYRSCSWTQGEVDARIDRHEAALGYTTAVLYNIDRSKILFDVQLACAKAADLEYNICDHLADVRYRLQSWIQERGVGQDQGEMVCRSRIGDG